MLTIILSKIFESIADCISKNWDANLEDANLRDADLTSAIGNNLEIKILQPGKWYVVWTSDVMQIGCERHAITDWWGFSDDTIAAMDSTALDWWRTWKPILQQVIAAAKQQGDTT